MAAWRGQGFLRTQPAARASSAAVDDPCTHPLPSSPNPTCPPSAAADSSSSAASYLDSEFEDSGGALQGAANSVEGVTCTSETIEAALTKAFHITGALGGDGGGWALAGDGTLGIDREVCCACSCWPAVLGLGGQRCSDVVRLQQPASAAPQAPLSTQASSPLCSAPTPTPTTHPPPYTSPASSSRRGVWQHGRLRAPGPGGHHGGGGPGRLPHDLCGQLRGLPRSAVPWRRRAAAHR